MIAFEVTSESSTVLVQMVVSARAFICTLRPRRPYPLPKYPDKS